MALTPLTKWIVILSFLAIAGGLYVLINSFFVTPGLLPPLALGTNNHTESWGIIGTGLVFFAWFLMYLVVKLEGL